MTGGEMGYKEVVILVEELENLLHIPLEMLNIKKMQARLFIDKVGEILRILEMEGAPNFPEQLVEEIIHLARPIGDFIKGPGRRIVRSNVEYIMSIGYGWGGRFTREVPEIVEQIGLVESKLEQFLDETDLYEVWEDLDNNLALLPSRVVVRDLLQASQELKEAINFFHEVSTESAALREFLRFLIGFLGPLQCECSHELVEGIRNVANKALDAVNCRKKDRLISCFLKFQDVLLGYSTRSIEAKKNSIEKMAKKFFDGKNGKRLVLLETLGKLHCFRGEIDMICEKLGRQDLQSSKLETYSAYFFSLSKEIKRRRNGSLKKTSRKPT